MELVKVDTIQKGGWRKAQPGSVQLKVEEFIAMNTPFARVDYTREEYRSPIGCANSLSRACDRCGFPAYATMRNGEVYLVRTDMGVLIF